MPKKYDDAEILGAYYQAGTKAGGAELLKMDDRNYRRRLNKLLKKQQPQTTGCSVLPPAEEHRLERQNKLLRKEVKDLKQQLAEDKEIAGLLSAAASEKPARPLSIKRPGKKKPVVAATAFLSDTHFDETVNPDEMNGVNAYDRDIAERRLQVFGEKTILMAHNYMAEFNVHHLDIPLGGDIVSGNIHDELARSNQDEIMGTVVHWSTQIQAMICGLAKEFRTIHVPCVVGNHGRNTKKPRHKGKVRDNFDWLIYQTVQRLVERSGAKNVSFQIAPTSDVMWETEGYRYLMTHGDQARGGTGWGGIYSPIMRMYEKKVKREAGFGRGFDYLILGHWHQYKDLGRVVINGSLKGYDEFANDNNFEPEPPQQGFWLTDKRFGKILSAPLFVADGEDIHMRSRKAA